MFISCVKMGWLSGFVFLCFTDCKYHTSSAVDGGSVWSAGEAHVFMCTVCMLGEVRESPFCLSTINIVDLCQCEWNRCTISINFVLVHDECCWSMMMMDH